MGFAESDLPIGTALLDSFKFLALDMRTADDAARIRRRTKLKLPDAIQAAFAVCNDLLLATRNTKDFAKHEFSFVSVPYEL